MLKLRHRLAGAGLCLAASATVFYFAWQPVEPVQAAPSVQVTVAGRAVDLTADRSREIERVAQHYLSEMVTVSADGDSIARTRAELGARVDGARLAALMDAAYDPESALRRTWAAERGTDALDLPLPITFDVNAARPFLVDLKDDLDRPTSDARVDTETRQVIPERHGRTFDVWATLDRIESAMHAGQTEVDAVIELRDPARGAEDFGELVLDTVIGEFETRYNASIEARDRTANLRVAGAKIDGYVLLPGEVFDYNEVVGPRDRANGFLPAPVIAGGELVDGVGGGACQVAGTVHAAAFFAGLEILERSPHSRPSFYIKLGLDAAVAYPNINLRIRNDRDHPIAIEFKVDGGVARARILGTGAQRMVSFVRRIESVRGFDERVVQDRELPAGVRVLSQRGVPGFTIRRWRVVRDLEINQAFRESFSDVYPPTTQIWREGAGGPAPEGFTAPPGDSHPEYTADEYLTLTRGPGIDGFQEVRRAGRTGSYGWTAREGMIGTD